MDVFKKSFLESFTNADISPKQVIIILCITLFLSILIFIIYRITTKKTFYSRDFNLSLICVSLITAAIIITIQSSIVVSLGMVGALSIVRFRTAIKNPMDLAFLFWAISIGIICGAKLAMFAVILSLLISIVVLIMKKIPNVIIPMILVVNCSDINVEGNLIDKIKDYSRHVSVMSRNITAEELCLTIELRTDRGNELIKDIIGVKGVKSANLLHHDGEVSF